MIYFSNFIFALAARREREKKGNPSWRYSGREGREREIVKPRKLSATINRRVTRPSRKRSTTRNAHTEYLVRSETAPGRSRRALRKLRDGARGDEKNGTRSLSLSLSLSLGVVFYTRTACVCIYIGLV